MNTPETVATLTPAAPFAGGFYAGIVVVDGRQYAIVVAPKADGEHDDTKWNKTLKAVAGAGSYFDGLANTKAMADAGSALGKWALSLRIGEFADWYLPSRDELELLYRAFKPTTQKNYQWRSGDNPSSVPAGYPYTADLPTQASVEAFRDGGAEAFADTWYWTSTQSAPSIDYAWCQDFDNGDFELPKRKEQSIMFGNVPELFAKECYWSAEQYAPNDDYAWCQDFDNGDQTTTHKTSSFRARAVRRVPV